MIQIDAKVLTQEEQRLLRDWINSPGTFLYQRYLAHFAAALMAEGANLSVTGEDSDQVDAKLKFEEAKVVNAAGDFIEQLRARATDPTLNFQLAELKPQLPTTP
ncbi:MAG: hypothetical protein WC655_04150 [Candidatus Hydrogenedentales bacterium]|jgi:hypothetical protein